MARLWDLQADGRHRGDAEAAERPSTCVVAFALEATVDGKPVGARGDTDGFVGAGALVARGRALVERGESFWIGTPPVEQPATIDGPLWAVVLTLVRAADEVRRVQLVVA